LRGDDRIVCEACGRRGRYNVSGLIERHGDAKLTDLLRTLADRPKARSARAVASSDPFNGSSTIPRQSRARVTFGVPEWTANG
jgi:hypothetical protein